jgi:osmotically-inducible protein OsmY
VGITHCVTAGPLLAGTLGVAAFGAFSAARSAPPAPELQHEIVVTAQRQSDEALTTRVETALQQNPYIFSEHVTVTTENGIVRVGGVVRDMPELFAILRLARRIAGKGRVVNEIEFLQLDQDGN